LPEDLNSQDVPDVAKYTSSEKITSEDAGIPFYSFMPGKIFHPSHCNTVHVTAIFQSCTHCQRLKHVVTWLPAANKIF
jgi:hypothetical protein